MRIHRKGMNGTSEFIIPGFVGIMVFVIVPLVDVFISSFQKSGTENFAGLQNYALVMENDAFRLAAGNSLHFELVSVPLLIVISLVVAIEVHGMKSNIIKFVFLIPMAIPSNSLTVVWSILFDDQGVVNNMIVRWGIGEPVSFFSGRAVFWLFVCTFIFKNIGSHCHARCI